MKCPECGSTAIIEVESEYEQGGDWAKLKQCESCEYLFTVIISTKIVERIDKSKEHQSDADEVTQFY